MAKPKQKIEKNPTTLDAALAVINAMKSAHENTVTVLHDQMGELEVQVEDATERANDALQYVVEDLARIHIKMKAGRINEAIDDLDRVLQEHDGDCKARTSAVAVMI